MVNLVLETTRGRRLLLAAALGAALIGCRGRDTDSPASPTRIRTGPVAVETDGAGPAVLPMATWTLPPGSEAWAPAPLDGPGRVPAPAAATPAGAPMGGIPEPSPLAVPAVRQEGPPAPDPAIARVMDRVDAGRLTADVRRLQALGSSVGRSGDAAPAPASAAVADWLQAAFTSLAPAAGAQVLVEREPFVSTVAGRRSEQVNVIATVAGIGLRKRFVYVVARAYSPPDRGAGGASGAHGDAGNASGAAVILEAARVLSERQWDATLRFVALAPGEDGAAGARHHAGLARQVGLPIEVVMSVEEVGGAAAGGAPLALIHADGPEDGPSRRLARHAAFVARLHGLADVAPGPGTDPAGAASHLAFGAAGFAALRLTDAAGDRAQRGDDGPGDDVVPESLAERARLTVALVANLALAPSAPVRAPVITPVDGRPGALRLSWSPVDDPSVSGYWIGMRSAAEGWYSVFSWAGAGTEHTVGDVPSGGRPVVAVAAADALGHVGLFGPEAGR